MPAPREQSRGELFARLARSGTSLRAHRQSVEHGLTQDHSRHMASLRDERWDTVRHGAVNDTGRVPPELGDGDDAG
jgi:hypothetical protein